MRIAKEVWLVVAIVAFLLAWLIDRLAGPVIVSIKEPFAFLQSSVILNRYPFTATAVIIRTIAIFISVMLITSLFQRKFFTKAIILFFVSVLAEFFAIQQLPSNYKVTTLQWTLSIAYASFSMSVGIIYLILMGIWSFFNKGEIQKTEETKEESSVLEPPKQ